jgi:NADH-quinone oxidoreductase subunit J
MIDTLLFYVFALLVLGGGILTITRTNVVHSAIFLITSLIGVAGLYLLQQAEFLFAVQIVLYVGGIMLLFLFVIMLVNLDQASMQRQFNTHWWIALAAVVLVGLELFYVLRKGASGLQFAESGQPTTPPQLGNVETLADVLFSEYLLPFEIASVLLLVAIVGSVVMAKKRI